MRINWCDKHNAPPEVDGVFCMGEGNGSCRWVPMRLIPDNAELEAILHDHFTEDAQAVLDALDGLTS